MRNEPGLVPISKAPSLDGIEGDARVAAMVEWFFENFEDPSSETPHDGREGGFLYIHGGPYEAQDFIPDAFPDATEEEHFEAIEQIESDGPEFAPAGHRILGPEEEYDDLNASREPISVRLDTLGSQLEEIKGHINEMLALQRREREADGGTPKAGHNNPPPDDEPDFYELLDSVADVEGELAKPDRETTADVQIVALAEGRFSRFVKWIKGLVAESPTLLAKGTITGIGGWAANYALNHQAQLIELVHSAAQTMFAWIGAIVGFA
ncbi:hypothetical protein BH10PLA2_BH10PLA2_00300 [soil metagenome]